MNDDLHKTYEPKRVSGEIQSPPSSGGWQMPEPVFRRSSGRVGGISREVPHAPSVIPERINEAPDSSSSATEPPLNAAPQPVNLDTSETVEPTMPIEARLQDRPETTGFPVWMIVVVLLALIGIISAIAIALYKGYVVWR